MLITSYTTKEVRILPVEAELKLIDERLTIYSELRNILSGVDFDTFEWSSSDTDVVICENSTLNYTEIIAKGAGDAIITLSLKKNNEVVYSATCEVTSYGYTLKMLTPKVYVSKLHAAANVGYLVIQNDIPDYDSVVWEPSTNAVMVNASYDDYAFISANQNYSGSISVYAKVIKDSKVIAMVSAEVYVSQDIALNPLAFSNNAMASPAKGIWMQSGFLAGNSNYDSYEWTVSDSNLVTLDNITTVKALAHGTGIYPAIVAVTLTLKLAGETVYVQNGGIKFTQY